ncbi:amidohydrolase family protein [[Clostridium] hylemonae]|uniref:amidohydrolase family protein n=1 Tax=[Clostridium] hylemonae TaxID=89153 RepID=UPI001FCC0E53|nr:amidohydrolase [[Clostridium] hylemonae]BDF04933.1 5-methylthioadenosine/S-adenosylhomocysteine deaminase [[Clostridium] hylemonae]
MNIRFYNARILSMEKGTGIEEGEVWVKGPYIVYRGPGRPSDTVWDREIDVKGNVLMPGFKNAHTHSAMTFLRSYADDMPLLDWLNKQVFPMEAKLTSEDMYHLSKLAVMEYLTSGITANFDMYMDPVSVAEASADCGFRTVLCGAMNNFSQSLEKEEQWYKELNDHHELVSFCFGAHAEYTTSRELLEGLSELAHKYKAPVYLHNSETKEEVEQCIGRYNRTPTALLAELGIYDHGGGGYHCVYMTEEDMDIFREKGLYAVTNPGSNTKLASGIAPVKQMIERGIPVAIGTDGPASNNCLDMFREMFLVTGLAKLKESDAAAVDADEVLKMAVVNGAHAMGLHDCDVLAEGKYADLTVLDLHQPNMQPLNNITKNIVYSGSKQNVVLTMVNGRILYENGVFHIGEEPEDVYARANEIIERIR